MLNSTLTNMLCEGEQTKICHNFVNIMIQSKPQTGSNGMDGSYIDGATLQ